MNSSFESRVALVTGAASGIGLATATAFARSGAAVVLAETADATPEDLDRVSAVNPRGIRASMQYELRQMREQGGGAIVDCASLGGPVGGAERGTHHAARHGVLGLTKRAALEYATRGSRHGRADEIADAVPWRCSAAASYVAGQSIAGDGGPIMR